MAFGLLALLALAVVGLLAPWASADSPRAAGKPSFQYLQDLAQGPNSITLGSTFNPNGLDTTLVVEYGTTASYGSSTTPQDEGAGTVPVTVTTKITGLQPDTGYYLRVEATNSAGTATAETEFFTSVSGVSSGAPAGHATPSRSLRLARVPVASARGPIGSFAGVACPSSSRCFAVGNAGPNLTMAGSRPLVERWNGRSFAVEPSPGVPDAALEAISCSGPRFCMAVGEAGAVHSVTLAETWNGRAWARVASPSPDDVGRGEGLTSVSCLSPSSCWAVGLTAPRENEVGALLEHWNGRSWSVVAAPIPRLTTFWGVSCVSSSDCWAVGAQWPPRAPSGEPLAEHWNGHAWAVVATPGSHGPTSTLGGVSCPAAASCWAVSQTQLLHLVGGFWRLVPVGAIGVSVLPLSDVNCASAQNCWLVGDGVRHWNGTTWAAVRLPAAGQPFLTGIACATAAHCIAVGGHGRGAGIRPFAAATP